MEEKIALLLEKKRKLSDKIIGAAVTGEKRWTKEELLEVDHIIDDAAKLEDKDMINLEHKTEDKIKKEHARDPERDW